MLIKFENIVRRTVCTFSFTHTEDTSVLAVVVARIVNMMARKKNSFLKCNCHHVNVYYVCAFDRWSKYISRMRIIASSNRAYHSSVACSFNFAPLFSNIVVLDVLAVSEEKYILFHV